MNTKKYSNRQEKQIAKKINGKKQANSGATMFMKGDVATDYFLIEAKTMTKEQKSITIKKEWLEQIKQEAFVMRKQYSALSFNFGGLGNTENFYIIDERVFILFNELLSKDMDEVN